MKEVGICYKVNILNKTAVIAISHLDLIKSLSNLLWNVKIRSGWKLYILDDFIQFTALGEVPGYPKALHNNEALESTKTQINHVVHSI